MGKDTITVELERAEAEVLLGVLAAERHNPEAEEVCESVRQQIDEKLAKVG